jgi:hypothetical protein
MDLVVADAAGRGQARDAGDANRLPKACRYEHANYSSMQTDSA